MKKYMIIAKNDYNEEIFYTDIKAEAKKKLDYCFDKYLFVKAYCYSYKDEMYKDITELNEPSKYVVHSFKKAVYSFKSEVVERDDKYTEFTNEADALRYIINSERVGYTCRLYKNEKRVWNV